MNPTLSWERVGSTFYRIFEGYNLEWSLKLPENHLTASSAGGLVAVWDRTDVIRQGGAIKPQIRILSGAGKTLLAIPWDGGPILAAGFTIDEVLVVVTKSGHVKSYYDLAGNFTLIKVEEPLNAEFGLDTVIETPTQFAILDSAGSGGPAIRFLDKPQLNGWTLRRSDLLEIIYWTDDAVYALDFDGSRKLAQESGCQSIVASPDGSLLALRSGSITSIWRQDFSKKLNSFEFTSLVTWVGSDAVIESIPSSEELEIKVHDISTGSSCSLFLEPDTKLQSEIDGVRIFTSDAHNLLSKVPPFVVEIFRLGSNAPSSVLLNCIDMLEQNSPRANENLSLIKDLPAAIQDCFNAATFEMDPRVQKKLLKAAHFGKSSLELYDSTGYLEALKIIRIGNTVRDPKVALFCTIAEIRALKCIKRGLSGSEALVPILEKRKVWETAIGLAKLQGMPVESIPIAWACDFIQTYKGDDETLKSKLDERLPQYAGLSYVDIGRKAFDEGRIQLALVLVAREPNPRKRVDLLMDMKEYQMALDQSVVSGLVDLVYYVLLVLRKKLSLPQFYRSFSDNEIAVKCYQDILSPEKGALHDFNYQMDRREDDFRLQLSENFSEPEPMLITSLQKQTRGYFNKSLGEYAKLLELQRRLQHDLEAEFENLTVTQTLGKLLMFGQTQRAEKVKGSFGISDQQYWWLRVGVLADRRDWDGLWQFSQQKSPIGYLAFYDACKNAGNFEAARRYIELCAVGLEDKVQKLMELGYQEEAMELAKGDEGLLARVGRG